MILCPMPRTILVADDDPHIRQLLVFALRKAGLDTLEAGDGEETMAMVSGHRPDLVVLDINMPRMDGIEVCRRLRAAGDLPILFLSSRDDEIDRILGDVRTSLDVDKQNALLRKAWQIVADESGSSVAFSLNVLWGMSNNIRDVRTHSGDNLQFHDAYFV